MKQMLMCSVALCCAALAASPKSVSWTGWFSDQGCAEGRVKSGLIAFTNPECAATCIKKGAAAVFISENAKAMYAVKGYNGVLDDLGYHVEVQARVDDEAKTIEIQSVKHLEVVAASCSRKQPATSH
jgi:hypothetical protein